MSNIRYFGPIPGNELPPREPGKPCSRDVLAYSREKGKFSVGHYFIVYYVYNPAGGGDDSYWVTNGCVFHASPDYWWHLPAFYQREE